MINNLINTARFTAHLQPKKCLGPKAPTPTLKPKPTGGLKSYFPPAVHKPTDNALSSPPPPIPATIMVPCPGITAAFEPKMSNYLERTRAGGGGAKDITIHAAELFPGRAYKSLKQSEKDLAYAAQTHDLQWRNDFSTGIKASFATGRRPCLTLVQVQADSIDAREPCKSCKLMHATPEFQKVIAIPMPDPANRKFVPHRYQDAQLGQLYSKFQGLEALLSENNKDSYEQRFIRKILNGDLKNDKLLYGIMQVKVLEQERRDGGKKMQNFKHNEDLDAIFGMIFSISPRCYRELRKHIPLRTERSIKQKISSAPRFPLATRYCADYNYPSGAPLSLAVDDTKLHAALRPLYNGKLGKWFIVGSTGEPTEVPNPDLIVAILGQIEAGEELATKLRLWILQIPLSKVPPLVLAVKAIGAKVKGPQLSQWHLELMRGLISRKFRVIASGGDGATVERECQRIVFATGTKIEHRIKFPVADPQYPDIIIPLSSLDGNVYAEFQDAKHGRKTYRNNASSGARGLVLGNHTVYFQQIHDLAMADDSPMYARDVKENRDKQDDRAAARLFSAATLEQAIKDPKKNLGLSVYLLVFGDLVDAWQSRTISQIERAKIAMRAHLSLETWKRFLAKAGYPESRHFISKEAYAISKILIRGLLGLQFIHRDHLDRVMPFFPWLYSSEPNEHCFAAFRGVNPDFTLQEALLMVPKIRTYMQSAVRTAIDPSTYKEAANGYCLTYFSSEDIDQSLQTQMPLDSAYSTAYQIAAEENDCLWSLLGIHPSVIMTAPDPSHGVAPQPDSSLEHLYTDESEVAAGQESNLSAAEEVQKYINNMKRATGYSREEDLALDNLTLASVALSMEELRRIEEMPDSDPSRLAEIQQEVFTALNARPGALVSLLMMGHIVDAASKLPVPPVVHERPPVSSPCVDVSPDDLAPLVRLRAEHQTREARMGIRTYRPSNTYRNPKTGTVKELTERQRLAQSMGAIVRREPELGTSHGLNRTVRWVADCTSIAPPLPAKTGNAANAEVTAAGRAKQTNKRRATVFKSLKCSSLVGDAGISPSHRLETESYGFAVVGTEIVLARVLTMYAKKGSKASTYSFIRESDNIGGVFYLLVQTFQHLRLRDFRKSPQQHAALGSVLRFAHLTAHSFLRLLPREKTGSVDVKEYDGTLSIGPEAYDIYKSLCDEREKLAKGAATLNAVRGKAGAANLLDMDEDEDDS
ncbi:hypothetical protein C8F01DRAFT_1330777 [Mycena amicta]|nr:hypothetical protein C8F01DRAFT_1330777 [Mycena amicta]